MTELDHLLADMERESARVGVDWNTATARMRELASIAERPLADGESTEIELGLDVTSLIRVLRALPTGAGTAAFLAAFADDQRRDDSPRA